eukprot:2821178-Amphidinium_carterae.1
MKPSHCATKHKLIHSLAFPSTLKKSAVVTFALSVFWTSCQIRFSKFQFSPSSSVKAAEHSVVAAVRKERIACGRLYRDLFPQKHGCVRSV